MRYKIDQKKIRSGLHSNNHRVAYRLLAVMRTSILLVEKALLSLRANIRAVAQVGQIFSGLVFEGRHLIRSRQV